MLVGAGDGGLSSLHLGLHRGPVEPFPTLLIGQAYVKNIKISPGGDCGASTHSLGAGKGKTPVGHAHPSESHCPCTPGGVERRGLLLFRQTGRWGRSTELGWGCCLPLLERWLSWGAVVPTGPTGPSLQNHTVLPSFHCPRAWKLLNCILCTLFSLCFYSTTSKSLIRWWVFSMKGTVQK